jgi:hypothetical protein
MGARQVMALAPPDLAQLLGIDGEGEGLGIDRLVGLGQTDFDQGVGPPSWRRRA